MVAHIRPAQLADWLRQCRATHPEVEPIVLDVREPWEVQTASIRPDGFELRHVPMATIPLRLAELPRERPIACLCHHGGRSAQVAYYLQRQGFEDVVNIAGGIHAWAMEVDPSVPQY
ncbi:rhodanese-like domain-containing protein [Tepidimonas charontis]|uniref:Putative adenylyltransferase/sulfurtransferase MoeZ n=1 Tax=Tepidimonas charontis TaxID=2267262 RepID=A0A554XK23_9BURK|nr:rhodanese-like domain-containing protein [Tepidimonas charontis]TSE36175.1 putative adenylyltransferase/sulfurtransferase MoeZ [Tepidimonas charontis]